MGVSEILNGNSKTLIKKLEKKMQTASENLEFEQAAQYRDNIICIKSLSEKQNISSTTSDNIDFVGIYQEGDRFCVQILFYRKGKAVGSKYFTVENEKNMANTVLESVVKQYYFTQKSIPREILLSENIEDKESIAEWLSQIAGHKVTFSVPVRGKKADIMRMTIKNAQESLYKDRMLKNRDESYRNRMLVQLSDLLNLSAPPMRIESYDISNFSGNSTIGVQIVYENAAPAKSKYRKFNIKTVEGQDDYECMREVIFRRINEAYKEEDLINAGTLAKDEAKFLPLPDLFLLDGGKGHVSAIKMLLETLCEDIPVYGIVKDRFHKTRGITDENGEFSLEKSSELFGFLACMQDEVHRFAIDSSRKKHEKRNTKSSLELITGVGEATRKKLLKEFKSITNIKNADVENLQKVVSKNVAENIYKYFHSQKED